MDTPKVSVIIMEGALVDNALLPLEGMGFGIPRSDEALMASRSYRGEVKLAPFKARRLRMLKVVLAGLNLHPLRRGHAR